MLSPVCTIIPFVCPFLGIDAICENATTGKRHNPHPKLSNVARGFTDPSMSSHQLCRICSIFCSLSIQSHKSDIYCSTEPRFWVFLPVSIHMGTKDRWGHPTDFSRILISQTRLYSDTRMVTSQVTAAMKKGHVGYKAVYNGPASGRDRMMWESLALSFATVGCDLVRLRQGQQGKPTASLQATTEMCSTYPKKRHWR